MEHRGRLRWQSTILYCHLQIIMKNEFIKDINILMEECIYLLLIIQEKRQSLKQSKEETRLKSKIIKRDCNWFMVSFDELHAGVQDLKAMKFSKFFHMSGIEHQNRIVNVIYYSYI